MEVPKLIGVVVFYVVASRRLIVSAEDDCFFIFVNAGGCDADGHAGSPDGSDFIPFPL
jgi:hypothetical protein